MTPGTLDVDPDVDATIEARRAFKRELEAHPLVDSLDFTRDGYQTIILELATGQEGRR